MDMQQTYTQLPKTPTTGSPYHAQEKIKHPPSICLPPPPVHTSPHEQKLLEPSHAAIYLNPRLSLPLPLHPTRSQFEKVFPQEERKNKRIQALSRCQGFPSRQNVQRDDPPHDPGAIGANSRNGLTTVTCSAGGIVLDDLSPSVLVLVSLSLSLSLSAGP